MSGRRPLAVRNVAHPRYKYNNNSQYRKYPDHLFCQKLCLLPTALSFTALFDSGLYSILQALFLQAYRERCAFCTVTKSRCRCGLERKKLIFFEKSDGKVCIFHIICRIFASLKQNGALVQLVRMPACHAGGRWFESCTHRKRSNEPTKASCFSLF